MSRATISSAVMITYQAWAKPLSRPSSPANPKTMNDQPEEKQSWWQRLSGGLKRTSASIGGAGAGLVVKPKLDQEMIDEIEEVLIRADLGLDTAVKIAAAVGEGRYDKSITSDEVKAAVAAGGEKGTQAV